MPEDDDSINNGISVTAYPDIVYTIEPVITHVTYLLRMVRWKQGYTRQSIAALLVWTFVWFHPFIVAYTLPIYIAVFVYYGFMTETPIHEKASTANVQDNLTAKLKEIQYELSMMLPSAEFKDQFKQYCRSLFVLSIYQKLLQFVSVYTIWITCLGLFGLDKMIWCLGSIAFTWNSPLFRVIRYSYHRAAFILRHANRVIVPQKAMTSPHKRSKSHEHFDRCYHFKVIEHQRWWFHKGWTALLLPNERPEWSDEYLIRVPSTQKFQLPPPTTKVDPKTQKMTTITWQWVSQEWQIDDNRNVDKDGWEYGNWNWESWGSKSSGLRVLTRRRHWVRNARLIIKEAEEGSSHHPAPIHIKRSSSCSTSTSVSLSSTSYSSSVDSSSSYLCTTPTSYTSNTTTDLLHRFQTKSYSTSTISQNHHQTVEPASPFSDTASTVDSHFWLRR
ncbi:uncharacterized protein ATC70_007124 [Mucor velutinosus]|uniref:TECPR1-like DysF domain-containing protein n=1 Tax=Mucor velutinosus TaxID=708070 RepID=A0AAN7D8H9_9FUNG|nr:hypothetical protein ATC70_007124 [Mucor velutinosus]